MSWSNGQTISLIVNFLILALSIGGTSILIWRLKFNDKNTKLLFILYILYWMAPIMTREYTGQMHLHLDFKYDNGVFLFIPIMVYGIIGLFWRPLNDVLTYKMKSRKKVLYLSIALQFFTIVPFIAYPCFITNIIQSIGAGIGASAIGLFNMMFDESYHHRKVFKTVSIIALPPLIAELISSAMEAILMTFLPHKAEGADYWSIVWFLWVFSIIFIIASWVVTVFIKEKPQMLYKTNIVKEPVKKGSDWAIIVLMCVVAIGIMLIRWATAGPTATTQLIWVGEHRTERPVDTRFFEAYLSLIYALGQLVGMIISGVWLTRSKNKYHVEKIILFIIAGLMWMIYLGVTSHYPSVPMFFGMNFINGLGFGIVWNIVLGIMMKKIFMRRNIITPVGVFNTFLSLGVCMGGFLVNMVKGNLFDPETPNLWETFIKENYTANMWIGLVTIITLLAFAAAYVIYVKCPPSQPIKVSKQFASQGETEV